MMQNTKNFTMRHRLNREVSYSDEFKQKYMINEYGNYDKYEKNKIEVKYREDEKIEDKDMIYENYLDMIKKLPTKEKEDMESEKRQDIHNLLTN